MFNWSCAFIVVKFYPDAELAVYSAFLFGIESHNELNDCVRSALTTVTSSSVASVC